VHDTVRILVHDTTFVLQPDNLRLTDWISVALTFGLVFAAFATIGVEIWREKRRRREDLERSRQRTLAMDSRISAQAYALRRQMHSWFENTPDLPAGKLTNDHINQWVGPVRSQARLDSAEERFRLLVGEHPEASPKVADAVVDAYVLFLRATEYINFVTRTGSWESTADNMTKLRSAYDDLRGCIPALERALDDRLRQR
jgi:hypothetical protein